MLAESIKSTPFEQGKEVYATKGRHILSSGHSHSMPECDHEEAENWSKNSGYRHSCDSSWGFWTAS